MKPIVDPDDFPTTRKCTYLDAANVALMYRGAEKAIIDWQKDIAENGSMSFDESADIEKALEHIDKICSTSGHKR